MPRRDRELDRYTREGALLFGGVLAILLQLGDPVVARGVAAHSSFATDPLGRLRRTLEDVYAIRLGRDEHERLARQHVNRAHAGVPGAREAAHQLWVAATLYAIGVETHERLVGGIGDATRDEIYAASARLGTALQLPEDAWPATRDAFEEYWVERVAGLEFTPEALIVAEQLMHPSGPWWLRRAMPFVVEVTAALAPAAVRAPLGLTEDPARHARSLRRARTLVRVTPGPLRRLPSRLLLRGLVARRPHSARMP